MALVVGIHEKRLICGQDADQPDAIVRFDAQIDMVEPSQWFASFDGDQMIFRPFRVIYIHGT